MAGRHRRTPAWRRILLRLRRSDRAARTAALQAEVVALRATVRELRAELDLIRVTAAAATALARTVEAARWELELPLVQAALAPVEVAETRAVASATPAMAGVTSIALDLRPDTAKTEIVLADAPKIVLSDAPEAVLSDLPESALLDPKQARDGADSDEAATAKPAETILPERRTA
jgi:hypothetical protein